MIKDREKRRAYNIAYLRRHYQENKAKYKDDAAKRRHAATAFARAQKRPCIHCGEDDPCCIDWHHRDASQKVLHIAAAVQAGWSMQRLAAEIAKCDPVCANCHRKLHKDDPTSWRRKR